MAEKVGRSRRDRHAYRLTRGRTCEQNTANCSRAGAPRPVPVQGLPTEPAAGGLQDSSDEIRSAMPDLSAFVMFSTVATAGVFRYFHTISAAGVIGAFSTIVVPGAFDDKYTQPFGTAGKHGLVQAFCAEQPGGYRSCSSQRDEGSLHTGGVACSIHAAPTRFCQQNQRLSPRVVLFYSARKGIQRQNSALKSVENPWTLFAGCSHARSGCEPCGR
jgi:hypothetical protein